MSIAGKISTMSMADLIQWARTAQRTGVLKLDDEKGKQLTVLFRDGHIISSATNDRRTAWTAYLRYFGLCASDDIEAAFVEQRRTGSSVATILVEQQKLSREQAVSTLTEKTVEDVCDSFLWTQGSFHFDPTVEGLTSALEIEIDPIRIVIEGLHRSEIWRSMNAYIHPRSYYERTELPLVENEQWDDLRVARVVAGMMDGQTPVSDLLIRLPFGRFKIYRAISELLQHKVIVNCEVTSIADREKRMREKLNQAKAEAEAGRFSEAMAALQGLIAAHPGREEMVQELLAVTGAFERSVYEHNFTKEDVPVLTIGPEAMTRLDIHPTDAFLLSRVDGRLTVREILRISPVAEVDGLRSFKRLLAAKVIDFPLRKSRTPVAAIPAYR